VSLALAIPLFLGSTVLTLGSAAFFGEKLDHIGPRLGLPEAIVGLLTAAATDAPEVTSAVVALFKGEKEVSLGVVMGSNIFNLAAMIGVSAVLAGAVRLPRRALAVEGAVGLLATLAAAGLVIGVLSATVTIIVFTAALAIYLVIVTRSPADPKHGHRHEHHHLDDPALWKPIGLILPAVALIVIGSNGMVRSALVMADDWHVPKIIVGIIVLSVMTSLPDAFTAIRLALSDRGTAVVSETLGSNTINLVGGILLPALVVGLAPATGGVDFDLLWLTGMTVLVLLLLARPGGIGRVGGVCLVAVYVVFVTVQALLVS
jgi:cation:H+ antiporter